MYNKVTFSQAIEDYVVKKQCTYMEAVVSYAANNNVEIESAAKLLNPIIRKKIEAEAAEKNQLKYKPATLKYD